jgi:transposase InsO family protein
VGRKPGSTDVVDVLSDLFILRGIPGHVRSDNGPEFVAKAVRGGSPRWCEDGLHRARQPVGERLRESFNGELRDELLDGEVFYSPAEAEVVIESWRRHYNTGRPALGPGLQAARAGGGAMAGSADHPDHGSKPVMH